MVNRRLTIFFILKISTIAIMRLSSLIALPMLGGTTKTEMSNIFGPAATSAFTSVSVASIEIALTLR